MSEWLTWLIFLACCLGGLICLAALVDYWWKESIREFRDIWREDDEDGDVGKEDRREKLPARYQGAYTRALEVYDQAKDGGCSVEEATERYFDALNESLAESEGRE
jgi:hypothetical protein